MTAPQASASSDAALAACLFAVDPLALGGMTLRAAADERRERLLAAIRAALPPGMPVRKMPASIDDERLLGGLDLAATLHCGKPVLTHGLLAQTDGGILIAPSAERIAPPLAARLCHALDRGEVAIADTGHAHPAPCRIALILLDEGRESDEAPPGSLADRLALPVAVAERFGDGLLPYDVETIAAARAVLAQVGIDAGVMAALAQGALACGVASLRALAFTVKVARIHAALNGRMAAVAEDAAVAARLVLAPRATMLPANPEEDETPPPDSKDEREPAETDTVADSLPAGEIVIEAVRAVIPDDLLDRLGEMSTRRTGSAGGGRAPQRSASLRRGRPCGTRAGDLTPGARLNIVETLKAAVPWQKLRTGRSAEAGCRLAIRKDDFRILRFKQQSESLTIFLVDASGSSALNRLAEAKGAVELLLADCYVRRDEVAVIAFRGESAQLLLPPTRSPARAKRELAGLPAGGATPLASALDQACLLGQAAIRRGRTPTVVLLTDGRANIARDGLPGRERAFADALAAARAIPAARMTAVLLDIARQPDPGSRRLAEEMQAHYIPLPRADAAAISGAVKAAANGFARPRVAAS
ncbi:magnesium chelatase subunit D [Pseudorhodoplanes sp.]|uniref:magnesium chelatase subunit D n=1 Tax=Pseudorhodoplanes sp. TaxID=1934341 RepID=UPI00391A05F6